MRNTYKIVGFEDPIATLESAMKVQCSNGNWNYNPYLHGMANGMIFAHAVITGIDAVFLEAPDKWLCDIANDDRPTEVNDEN